MTNPASALQLSLKDMRRLPVSTLLLLLCGVMFAISISPGSAGITDPLERPFPGASVALKLEAIPEISGHFRLWQGELWRLFFNAFHHAGVSHLVMNALGVWALGHFLEPRLPRLRFLAFCLSAAVISMLPEITLGQTPVGVSGMLSAQVGLLLAMQPHDVSLQHPRITRMLWFSVIGMLVLIPVQVLTGLRIAHGAHFGGLFYGWLAGSLGYGLGSHRPVAARLLLTLLHAALFGWWLQLQSPVWDARYFAWRGLQSEDMEDWRQAIQRDPRLVIAWRQQAAMQVMNRDLPGAWKTILQAARINRTEASLDELARAIWNDLPTPMDKARALDDLRTVFADETAAWLDRLRLPGSPESIAHAVTEPFLFPDLPVTAPVSFDALVEIPERVPGITEPFPPEFPPGIVNPADPRSALAGELL